MYAPVAKKNYENDKKIKNFIDSYSSRNYYMRFKNAVFFIRDNPKDN